MRRLVHPEFHVNKKVNINGYYTIKILWLFRYAVPGYGTSAQWPT